MSENLYDTIIVGGGPAGLTAAIYLARARYRVLVVEKEQFGGQITITDDVVNYPGVESGSGSAITEVMRKQAESFGAEFLLADVTNLKLEKDIKEVETSRGQQRAFGVVLATGAHPRSIGFAGEEAFKGRGVAYCATCDGEFFTGMDIFVIGGGFAAAEEAVFLTRYAKKVTMLIREEDFTCAKATADLAKEHSQIEIHYDTVVESVKGNTQLESIEYLNMKTGVKTEYKPPQGETFGVFVFAGYVPNTDVLRGIVALDEFGYIVTDKNQKTSVEGVYAAGDVCVKNLRQMVTATADGAVAATELERYASVMRAKTGLAPKVPTISEKKSVESSFSDDDFFTEEVCQQLSGIFEKMQTSLVLSLQLDERPVSQELTSFVEELAAMTDKLSVEKSVYTKEDAPSVEILTADKKETGLVFHGVPGGHEFNSFIIGLYNAAGPGQSLEVDILQRIKQIRVPVMMKVLVSLSCTKCPELVMAAQRIAVENENIWAEVYDLNHFEEVKNQYKVMSVPCLIVNDTEISFGKKNVVQLLEYLESIL